MYATANSDKHSTVINNGLVNIFNYFVIYQISQNNKISTQNQFHYLIMKQNNSIVSANKVSIKMFSDKSLTNSQSNYLLIGIRVGIYRISFKLSNNLHINNKISIINRSVCSISNHILNSCLNQEGQYCLVN